ncbi:hypothetical protein KTE62_19110 [Burkholderia multivorans]|uniref:hypothetical protein n=1 Tax=Burkholderia multivorans TaxID=87883 RepID=UPI001C217395|nr:hypothetical protein [Burkholderia multivorans]MBU9443823.1 hypothetical protein [Burkholderia multivorans]
MLKDEHLAKDYSPEKHFIHYSVLSITLASRLVPENMEPSDAALQLMAAGETENYADPVRRLRDLVMVRYDRQLLSAVYDGDLNLYDTLTLSKIDVSGGRLRYSKQPESYAHAVLARAIDLSHRAVTANDQGAARATLAQQFARLDHLAWALVILAPDTPTVAETRYRQILGVTEWLYSLGLPFRHGNGLPAGRHKGVPVSGDDVRERQYLAVSDVRAAAVRDGFWPKALVQDEPAVQMQDRVLISDLASELATTAADANPELWVSGDNDELARDIAINLNQLRNEWSTVPSVLYHIATMLEGREIAARSVANNWPQTSSEGPIEHPSEYWLSAEDANKVRARLSLTSHSLTISDALPDTASGSEMPEQRQARRLARFRELGGDLEKVGGGQWRLTGRRGTLAALSREEKRDGRARHDERDVRNELAKAADAELREKSGS